MVTKELIRDFDVANSNGFFLFMLTNMLFLKAENIPTSL